MKDHPYPPGRKNHACYPCCCKLCADYAWRKKNPTQKRWVISPKKNFFPLALGKDAEQAWIRSGQLYGIAIGSKAYRAVAVRLQPVRSKQTRKYNCTHPL